MEYEGQAREILARVDRADELSRHLPDDFVIFRRKPWMLLVTSSGILVLRLGFAAGALLVAREAWRNANWGLGLLAAILSVIASSAGYQLRAVLRELAGGPDQRGLLVVTKDFVVKRAEGELQILSLAELPAVFQSKLRNRPASLYLGARQWETEGATCLLQPFEGFGSLDVIEQAIRDATLKRVLSTKT